MIIPIKCFTCGNVLANKYRYYLQEVKRIKLAESKDTNKVVYLTKENMESIMERKNLAYNKESFAISILNMQLSTYHNTIIIVTESHI
jgi:DNA-directed RNA polymerase subunit N (RpoN/RPB10)